MRPHVAAVYAFARVADDIADEGSAPPADRLKELHLWRDRIHRAAAGNVENIVDVGNPGPAEARDAMIALALGHSIRSLDLPLSLFDDLLSAFGQDTMTTRYDSWADVLDYCRRSANPVGRLVLRIGGYRDDALDRSSDALCTALQLTNFWQDFGRDWRAGRLYVPREELVACGAREFELQTGLLSPAWTPGAVAVGGEDAGAVRSGTARVRRRERPAADGAAIHLAGRRPHPGAGRTEPRAIARSSARARRPGRAAARVARSPMAQGMRAHAHRGFCSRLIRILKSSIMEA